MAGSAAAQVRVRLPDTMAARGATVSVPVYLEEVGVEPIFSVEVYLAYDPGQVSFRGTRFYAPDSQPTLLEDWLVDLTGNLGGLETYLDSNRVAGPGLDTLKIAAAVALNSARGLAVDGVLCYVDFQVSPDLRHVLTIPLDLTHVLLNDFAPQAVDGAIKLSGVDGVIRSAPALLARNQAIQIEVEDIDEDRTAGVDNLLVRVRVVGDGQQESLSIPETGLTSGVFAGTIGAVFSAATTVSGDGLVQVTQGDTIAFCYDDLLDASGGTTQRCDSTAVAGGRPGRIETTVVVQPADTVRIRVVDPDLNVDPGARDTVSVRVTNRRTQEQASALLWERGVADSVFFGLGFTRFNSGIVDAGDDTVDAQRGDTLFVLYDDVATGTGGGAVSRDTCLVVDPWGDASGDGKRRGFDASRILFHFVDIVVLSGLDSLSANVDSLAPFGEIDAFDASLVLRRNVGLIDHFPVQEGTALNHPQPESRGIAPKLSTEERFVALKAGPGYLALVAEDREGIVAGEVVVRGFSGEVVMADELGDFLVVAGRVEEGVRVAFAGVWGTVGAGELVRLFPAAGDRVELIGARFNGGHILGRLEGERTPVLPATFALEPNAPNPFNPETAIRYALPRQSPVRLEIFNIAGQRVRTLVQEEQSAGVHTARWDGCDGAGMPVAGGVYFYRLTAAGYEAVRRMVLVK